MFLLAILFPPLYFLIQKKMGMFLLTSAMFILAFLLMMTFVMMPFSLILWLIAAIMAMRHYRFKVITKVLDDHARKIGVEVAASLQKRC